MEQQLSEWIHEYLEHDEEYASLNYKQKYEMFRVYRSILGAIHKTLQFENVYPILIATNPASKEIIQGAINNLAEHLPSVNKITISLMH